jgi:hypothetical protein
MTEIDLKDAQLAFREAEIAATVKLFAQLNKGDAPVVNLRPFLGSKAVLIWQLSQSLDTRMEPQVSSKR